MEMLQAYSSNFLPPVVASQFTAVTKGRRSGRRDSVAKRQLNSGRAGVSRAMGEEWVVVQRAIAGDTNAQERLFARHIGKLYRIAFAVLRNKEDAEDALQDGLCNAYTKLRSFQGRSSFATWLTRIAINSALMTFRRRKAHPETSLDAILESQSEWLLPYGVVKTRPDPEQICAAIEIEALVEQHVGRLPAAIRAAFQLGGIDGLSGRESSRALGIPVSAFKSRIFRARRKLACGLQQSLESDANAPVFERRGRRNTFSRPRGQVIEFRSPVRELTYACSA